MTHTSFDRPVVVQPGRIDRDRVISTISDAAQLLLYRWPDPTCVKRREAVKACIAVMKGERPPYHARRAFVAAAKEARILLDDGFGVYISQLTASEAHH